MSVIGVLHGHVASYSVRGVLALLDARVELDPPVRASRPSGIRVRVTVRVPDTAGPGTVEVSRVAVAASDAPADLDAAVWTALLEVLAHECGECLLRDGQPVYDPHELPRVGPWRTP